MTNEDTRLKQKKKSHDSHDREIVIAEVKIWLECTEERCQATPQGGTRSNPGSPGRRAGRAWTSFRVTKSIRASSQSATKGDSP